MNINPIKVPKPFQQRIMEQIENELMLPIEQLVALQGVPDGVISYPKYSLDIGGLIRFVTNATGISPFDMSRRADAVYVRMAVMYRLHKEGIVLKEIGRILKKNHSTVIYNIRSMNFALEHPNLYPFVVGLWNKITKEYPL